MRSFNVAAVYDGRLLNAKNQPATVIDRRYILLVSTLILGACSSGTTAAKLDQVKPGMKPEQVQALLGRPASIDQSQTPDQTLSGEVDHYPGRNGEGRVLFINNVVFKAEFVSGAKS